MRKKIFVSFILLIVTLFSFWWFANAWDNVDSCQKQANSLDNAFGSSDIRYNINNLLEDIDFRMKDETVQYKIDFYNNLLSKIEKIDDSQNFKLKKIVKFLDCKINNKIFDLIEQLEENSPENILGNIFSNVNVEEEKTYKVLWYNSDKTIYFDEWEPTVSEVKLWSFKIYSSDWKKIFIKNLWILFTAINNSKLPSIKYLKLVDSNWNFIANIKPESSWENNSAFILTDIELAEGDYTIIWDVSDLDNITEIQSKIEYIYDSSHKLIYDEFDMGTITFIKEELDY